MYYDEGKIKLSCYMQLGVSCFRNFHEYHKKTYEKWLNYNHLTNNSNGEYRSHFGFADINFKEIYRNHIRDFKHQKYQNSIELARRLKRNSISFSLHKKWSFPVRNSLVNVTKLAVFCGFGQIYWRNSNGKLDFLCAVSLKWTVIVKIYGSVFN